MGNANRLAAIAANRFIAIHPEERLFGRPSATCESALAAVAADGGEKFNPEGWIAVKMISRFARFYAENKAPVDWWNDEEHVDLSEDKDMQEAAILAFLDDLAPRPIAEVQNYVDLLGDLQLTFGHRDDDLEYPEPFIELGDAQRGSCQGISFTADSEVINALTHAVLNQLADNLRIVGRTAWTSNAEMIRNRESHDD
jgi:hypothetical protein